MSETEEAVACHYTTGVDPETALPQDLKAGDEFHTGGVAATDRLFAQLSVTEGTRVLDVGSGIGGTSRYVADHYGASVTGVDLTPEFVATARVLAPGGVLALFEAMAGLVSDPLMFPLPWSAVPETSFVHPSETHKQAAERAGLGLVQETDHSDFALAYLEEAFSRTAENGPSPLGIHLTMSVTAPEKFKNYVANLKAGCLRPTKMIFKKTGRSGKEDPWLT